jgi:hypothetical protein
MNEHLLWLKDKHKGERCLYFGGGNTTNEFVASHNNESGIRIGANNLIFMDDKLSMDYYFLTDPTETNTQGYKSNYEVYCDYQPKIAKLYRRKIKGVAGVNEGENAIYYGISNRINRDWENIHTDITKGISYGVTASLDIIQFIIYMGFKDIVLIGHDLVYGKQNALGIDSTCLSNLAPMILNKWHQIKAWKQKFLPDVNISVWKPQKLKGLFEEYEGVNECKKSA